MTDLYTTKMPNHFFDIKAPSNYINYNSNYINYKNSPYIIDNKYVKIIDNYKHDKIIDKKSGETLSRQKSMKTNASTQTPTQPSASVQSPTQPSASTSAPRHKHVDAPVFAPIRKKAPKQVPVPKQKSKTTKEISVMDNDDDMLLCDLNEEESEIKKKYLSAIEEKNNYLDNDDDGIIIESNNIEVVNTRHPSIKIKKVIEEKDLSDLSMTMKEMRKICVLDNDSDVLLCDLNEEESNIKKRYIKLQENYDNDSCDNIFI